MNATKAIKLLEPIPKDQFITNRFTDQESKCCAIGHLARLTSRKPNSYSPYICADVQIKVNTFVRTTVREFNIKYNKTSVDLSSVNNGNKINGYTEDNPKDRVMHLLYDMQKAGY